MKATEKIFVAARRAEFDHYQRNVGPLPFSPTPDAAIRAMLEAG